MKRTYTFIKNEIIEHLTKKEILEKLSANFYGSFARIAEIEEISNKLYVTKKDGHVYMYTNIHGSYGFPTAI